MPQVARVGGDDNDLAWVDPETLGVGVHTPLLSAALLVVEIVSPKTKRRDLGIKRNAYAASGVQHYWVIDGQDDRVIAHRLSASGQSYELVLDQTGGVVQLAEPIPVSFVVAGSREAVGRS